MTDLETIVTVNYGHFTSMLVEPAGVRGLGHHLARLDRDARIVFGHGLPGSMVRERLRAAVAGLELPLAVRVTVFARGVRIDQLAALPEPGILITTRPVLTTPRPPVRVRSSVYARDLPHVKHVGTFGLLHQRRLAQQAGYDDVLFVDGSGVISEGSVWNIGFFDGDQVVWPDAPALPGIEMALLSTVLPSVRASVRLSDVSGFTGAFITNAISGPVPVASINDMAFPLDPGFAEILATAHRTIEPEPV